MDSKIVCFIRRHGKCLESNDENNTDMYDAFMIRRDKVMNALYWLKKYNKIYRDDQSVIIYETNLDWMKNKREASFNGIIDILE